MEQAATLSVGNSTTQLKNITATFPQPFATTPVIVANTLQTDPNYPAGSIPDTFAVSITGVSLAGFTANILRVDSAGGWGQKLSLGYHATTP